MSKARRTPPSLPTCFCPYVGRASAGRVLRRRGRIALGLVGLGALGAALPAGCSCSIFATGFPCRFELPERQPPPPPPPRNPVAEYEAWLRDECGGVLPGCEARMPDWEAGERWPP